MVDDNSEAHGYGVYFAVYELLVANEVRSKGFKSRDELNLGKSALFGAAAGWGMWLLYVLSPAHSPTKPNSEAELIFAFDRNFPLDVLKSRIQTDAFPSHGTRKYPRGMRDAVPALYKEGGTGAFFRGLAPTMIRFVILSSSLLSLFLPHSSFHCISTIVL